MLTQPATTPARLPHVADPDVPIYYKRPSLDSSLVTNAVRNYRAIPAQVRAWFEAWHANGTGRFAFRLVLEDSEGALDQFGAGYGRKPGDVTWGGLYWGFGDPLYTHAACIRAGSDSVIHEFGHHIDYTYNQLHPAGNGGFANLTAMGTWTSLWNATYASIPSALYGATNIREWFAELWRCQVPSPASPNGDVSTFLQLCGNDRSRADTIRAAFTAALPMPSFTY